MAFGPGIVKAMISGGGAVAMGNGPRKQPIQRNTSRWASARDVQLPCSTSGSRFRVTGSAPRWAEPGCRQGAGAVRAGFDTLPFTSVSPTDNECAAELANRSVHG